jgi:hypothetical protein
MTTSDNPSFLSEQEIADFFSPKKSVQRAIQLAIAGAEVGKAELSGQSIDNENFQKFYFLQGDTEVDYQRSVKNFLEKQHPKDLNIFQQYPYFLRRFILDPSKSLSLEAHFYAHSVSVRDKNYQFEARITDDLILSIDAYLSRYDLNGEARRSMVMPHYSYLLPFAVKYFEQLGFPVKGVKGVWATEYSDAESTNLRIYQEAWAQGATPTEAALLTPAGKVASRNGFREVVWGDHPSLKFNGLTGVEVTFYKELPD